MSLTVPYVPAPGTEPPKDPGGYKPGRLPAKQTLEYAKLALEFLLLLLAVPWLLKQLVTHPGKVSRQAAEKHLKGA